MDREITGAKGEHNGRKGQKKGPMLNVIRWVAVLGLEALGVVLELEA